MKKLKCIYPWINKLGKILESQFRDQFSYYMKSSLEPINQRPRPKKEKWTEDKHVVHWKGDTNGSQSYGKILSLTCNKRTAN